MRIFKPLLSASIFMILGAGIIFSVFFYGTFIFKNAVWFMKLLGFCFIVFLPLFIMGLLNEEIIISQEGVESIRKFIIGKGGNKIYWDDVSKVIIFRSSINPFNKMVIIYSKNSPINRIAFSSGLFSSELLKEIEQRVPDANIVRS